MARAIDEVIKVEGDECVFLDMTHLDDVFLRERFPTIFAKCRLGIDMVKDPIPVVPAAHYMCGGVQVTPSLAQVSRVYGRSVRFPIPAYTVRIGLHPI